LLAQIRIGTPIGQSPNGDFAVLVPIAVPRIKESRSVDSVPLCFQSPRKKGACSVALFETQRHRGTEKGCRKGDLMSRPYVPCETITGLVYKTSLRD